MPNKQYTFSLPPEAGKVIDSLPKMAKSEHVAQALLYFEKAKAKQKALDIIESLNPQDWGTNKDAVTLVQEARHQRAEYLSNNKP